MKIKDLIKELQNLREDYKELPVTVVAPNGMRFTPKIKVKRKKKHEFNSEAEEIVLFYQD